MSRTKRPESAGMRIAARQNSKICPSIANEYPTQDISSRLTSPQQKTTAARVATAAPNPAGPRTVLGFVHAKCAAAAAPVCPGPELSIAGTVGKVCALNFRNSSSSGECPRRTA